MIRIEKQDNLDWYYKKIIDMFKWHRNKYHIEDINEMLKNKFTFPWTFEQIVKAEYSELKLIKKYIDKNGLKNTLKRNEVIDHIKRNKYEKITNDNINIEIIDNINITVCPYCNRDFINNRSDKNASAQLDHFYNKNEYPIFVLSFYNLVPSCYACNHIKHTKSIDISPYDEDFDFDESIKFEFSISNTDYINNHKSIDISITPSDEIVSNIDNLGLEKAYKLHSDYVQELIKKVHIYSDDLLDEYYNNYKYLFSSKEEMIGVLFGNYISNAKLGNRPLAKMTKDILYSLKVIK